MKNYIKILCLVVLTSWSLASVAQTYNNEWIDYSKTYYKFKLAKTGLYRINAATIQSLGLGNTPANQFQLWRNGQLVPIYLSNTDESTPMSSSDYIEFWGKQNDGEPDAELYKDKTAQLDKFYSLETDSASFFLTVNTDISKNFHYQKVATTAPAGTTPEPYCWGMWEFHAKNMINPGFAIYAYGDPIWSSTYDKGEGWTTNDITPGSIYGAGFPTLRINSAGPSAQLTVGIAGRSVLGTNRTVNVLLNKKTILDSKTVNQLTTYQFSIPIDNSLIASSGEFDVTHTNAPAAKDDRIALSYMRLVYPKNFSLSTAAIDSFVLDAKNTASNIVMTGFSNKTFTPYLYDITNGTRYTATIQGSTLSFYVTASNVRRHFIIVNQDNQGTPITAINSRKMVDYKSTAQGDFLIVTGAILRTGNDPVEKYRAYRSSPAGGGYNAQIYDASQLEDQFAFGIRMHSSSVKNFLKYARNTFTVKPKYALMLGHGLTYDDYNRNQSASDINNQAIVATFGQPASDNILASDDYSPIPATPIGRLSAITPNEVENYLNKLKEYESTQGNTSQTVDDKGWMKTAIHIAGGSDASQSQLFINYLKSIENIIADTLTGYNVLNFNKNTNSESAAITDISFRNLFKNGIGLINYWGHASSTALDYNLDDPTNYANAGKYPSFFVSGCDLAGYFSYDPARMTKLSTTPENYVFTPNAGSINFIAQSYLGVTTFMQNFNIPFFNSLAKDNYNKPMSISLAAAAKATIAALSTNNPDEDILSPTAQVEQNVLLGDPAIKVNSFAKADFDIEDASVSISPSYINVSQEKFHVKAYIQNLGKATGDSLLVQIKMQHADGSSNILYYKNIPSVRYKDSIELDIPINQSTDKGLNTVVFNLDPLNKYDELSKTNNVLNKQVFIYAVGLSPIYPYNYSIVNKQNTKLIASTANPIAPSTQYVMEIDTTALFNSAFKSKQTITSSGGPIEFAPGITFSDSTVYYWRVSDVPSNGSDYHWNTASFLYLAKSTRGGYNQSHIYQQFGSTFDHIELDSLTKIWSYTPTPLLFSIKTGIPYESSSNNSDFHIAINGLNTTEFRCINGDAVVFNLFDAKTFKPYYNNNGTGGFMGSSLSAGCSSTSAGHLTTNFEYGTSSQFDRDHAKAFMDWIPDGTFVVVRMFINRYIRTPRIPTWQTDPSGNSLYTSLVNAGFTNLADADYPKTWAFVYIKNSKAFKPITLVTTDLYQQLNYTTTFSTPDSVGYITSPKFGPAKAWHTMEWQGKSIDAGAGDNTSIDLFGIDKAGQSTYLRTLPMNQASSDISMINANTYPYLQMQMRNADSVYNTPYQLKYWRLFYDPVPEGALAANVYYKSDKDTLNKGADYNFAIAFKNISDTKFDDSIKVNYTLTDKNNVAHLISLPKIKALEPGDTTLIKVSVPGVASSGELSTTLYSGNNSQYLDVNPEDAQHLTEYTHVNNFIAKPLMINGDDGNAALDVTFDGLHILNNDIISATPKIIAKLSSDSKTQLVQDTSLLTVYLKYYPDNTTKRFKYGTDTLLFTPAKDSSDNFALANFAPLLTQDGTYQLIIQGKSSTDAAKSAQYSVTFQVYNKPMISDMFNYPNPFTTSTAFVFTLTGSVVPQNLRIEILTITGKIVKEITKAELGPLHIGRNITEYKWDGTDQYGQKLANGVYIYRVLTNLDGKKLDHFDIQNSNTGQYFNKGYGKMYLMR